MKKPTILIMAGGTGGHVFPALACAHEFISQGYAVEWLGSERGIENELVPQAGIVLHKIPVTGLRGKNIKALMMAPWQMMKSLYAAYQVFKKTEPICVLGMGGFAAGPGGLMAGLLNCPLVIHEQNAVAGTTNRLLAGIAQRVLSAYPRVLKRAEVVGNPVRNAIAALDAPSERFAQRNDALRLLVLGGSLGAAAINQTLPKALANLIGTLEIQVRHQAGRQHAETVTKDYQAHGVVAEVEPFIADMAEAYTWADLVICRAGALTMAELAAAGVGAICIPYPHAIDDHQTENARSFVEQGAGILLPQTELTPEKLAALIMKFGHRDTLVDWANAARKLAQKNSAQRVVAVCLDVARNIKHKEER